MIRYNISIAITVTSVFLMGSAAYAHWDRPSCYIEVHNGCYVDTTSPCSDEDYKDFLANCDATYPSLGARPGGLKAPTASGIGRN